MTKHSTQSVVAGSYVLLAQLCPILCDSMDCTRQAPLSMEFSSKNTGVGCHVLLQGIFPTQGLNPVLLHCRQILCHLSHQGVEVKVRSLSCVRLFATPWTVAYQASPSMGFSRQEYWSGLPFPCPEDLSDPWIKPGSPALEADALTSEPPGKPQGVERHP